jgi:hypothetical protein
VICSRSGAVSFGSSCGASKCFASASLLSHSSITMKASGPSGLWLPNSRREFKEAWQPMQPYSLSTLGQFAWKSESTKSR